ncbi:hypothetical protein Q4497_00455 [Mesomycoplasma ovipneumoniae]|uniref:Lipoprotein n=1 Tax=Mesomycoplasma ovipneumoniae TaxID=29562 RepID=A0AAW6Q3T0_9BACT|nr:hypothetical protein [Mesomycoplasma ovipneumoniae]MDF9627398.1 hypothetical protein [Mesomycoplasma ovipneumoniae]MDO4157491.1 hypothetical protein [Mesomycoplasma ovipneumoniae]MDO4158578.1 hypothetical protein [Mesomycoplasma ovipneumoniae]MDO6821498.1 hypothetical protein [Mesomycoplasma ovipneumoniae]MDO6856082.1 hypothetical protein [Mesomycoplasma ovipneumoniae]
MLHLIYKKLKKQKILLLTTSFLALPTLLVSCSDPLQEHLQELEKISKSIASDISKSIGSAKKTIPISEQNSEIIYNSVLGFNGQKKNPKVAKNRFDVTKHYTKEIPEASFISGKGGTGKYGLLPYWYFFKSIPKYLENKGFGGNKYNKEEYLKRLDYFSEKISDYHSRSFFANRSAGEQSEFDVWKQGLRSQFMQLVKQMKANLDYDKFGDLTDKDKVDTIGGRSINVDKHFPIIKPVLDRYNAQIPNDYTIKYAIVFDFLLANGRALDLNIDAPLYIDGTRLSNKDYTKEIVRYFRDEYYIKKGYKPSEPEKLWYELAWFILRIPRIYSSVDEALSILDDIADIEKQLFELTDKNKDISEQLDSKIRLVENFTKNLARFLTPWHHLNLRKDLVFNIDISNNQDDQSLISDFIEYYNQKIAPIIWRINETYYRIQTLTEILKDQGDDYYFNTYLAPLLPKIKDLPTEWDPTINNYSKDLREQARQEARKASIKEWGIWLKNYQEKYGINFKPDPEIDQEYFDYSSLYPVPTPESTETSPSSTLAEKQLPSSTLDETAPSSTLDSPSSTLDNTQQIPEQTEVINEESEPQRGTVESQSEPIENTSPSNTQQPNNIEETTEVINEESEPQGLN